MKDYVSGEELTEEEEASYMVMFVATNDPMSFKEAVKHSKWRSAMDAEMDSII